jgi:hypothetical protein
LQPGSNSQAECYELQVLDANDAAEWDRRVFAHPDYSFFHSASWAQVLCETYGRTPRYLVFNESNGAPIALVPLIEVLSPVTGRRGICLPFSDFCGPLVFTKNQRSFVEAELLRLARERQWNYIELRNRIPHELTSGSAVTYYGHTLDLRRPADAIFERLASSNRGAIRKAEKNGLEAVTLKSEEAIRSFFQLHTRTRRQHGAPSQPWKFFMKFHRNVIERGLGFIVVARMGAQTVAGAVFGLFGDRAVYKFAASNPAYLKSRANNLVLWHAIKQLVASGCKTLHFGRTGLANQGLRRFKLSWGAEEELISYDRIDAGTGNWTSKKGRDRAPWYSHCFRRLPVRLNNLVGAVIYPHLD